MIGHHNFVHIGIRGCKMNDDEFKKAICKNLESLRDLAVISEGLTWFCFILIMMVFFGVRIPCFA